MKKILVLAVSAMLALAFTGCAKKSAAHAPSIAVFITGIIADSPSYAHVAEGVTKGVNEYNATITDESKKARLYIMEAGTNQAEWASKMTALAATGEYDVILSSNPSMPELCEPISKQFPAQKFIFLDAAALNNPNMYSVSYNQRDQVYISGYMAGLYSKTHKVGLVAAQEYPIMNAILYPYFAKGAADAYPGTTTDFRVVGNWYDATKGAEITSAMFSAGIDMILPICGGAAQGVIATAREKGMHIVWLDENGFEKAPGVIVSCCMTNRTATAQETISEYLAGKTPWGTVRSVGFRDGYFSYFQDNPVYISSVPKGIREKMSALVSALRSGEIVLPQTLE